MRICRRIRVCRCGFSTKKEGEFAKHLKTAHPTDKKRSTRAGRGTLIERLAKRVAKEEI